MHYPVEPVAPGLGGFSRGFNPAARGVMVRPTTRPVSPVRPMRPQVMPPLRGVRFNRPGGMHGVDGFFDSITNTVKKLSDSGRTVVTKAAPLIQTGAAVVGTVYGGPAGGMAASTAAGVLTNAVGKKEDQGTDAGDAPQVAAAPMPVANTLATRPVARPVARPAARSNLPLILGGLAVVGLAAYVIAKGKRRGR